LVIFRKKVVIQQSGPIVEHKLKIIVEPTCPLVEQEKDGIAVESHLEVKPPLVE